MSYTLGIDLGSSFARAAVWTPEGCRALAAMPSVVAFPKKGDPTAGEVARRQAYLSPSRSFTSILPSLGSSRRREVDGQFYSSVEVAGILLRELRAAAQDAMGAELRRAVLSIPDRFGWEERRALREAAAMAGLHVGGFLVESCAAALGSGMLENTQERVLVCDAGGGSFRATVLEKGSTGVRRVSSSSTGDCSGSAFDGCIAAWLLQRFRDDNGVDLSRDLSAMQRIMEAAEEAKRRLTENTVTTVSIPYITAVRDEPLHMEYLLSRSVFYELSARLIREAALTTERALAEGGSTAQILLCGGGAAMPALREAVGGSAYVPEQSAHCAAFGAAMAAGQNYITAD